MTGHETVLLAATVTLLAPRDGAIYVDGTFGGGGLTAALLATASCRVIAIDRDPQAIAGGGELARRYPDRPPRRSARSRTRATRVKGNSRAL